MKIRLLSIFIVSAIVLLTGCDKGNGALSPFKSSNGDSFVVTDDPTCVGAMNATMNGSYTQDLSPNASFEFYYSPSWSTAKQLLESGLWISGKCEGTKFSASLYPLDFDKTYYYVAVVCMDGIRFCGDVKKFTTQLSQGAAIDMGLSVKWASCNVGASKPEQYGGYFQWGGTTDMTNSSNNLSYTNCPYHSGKDTKSGWLKYVTSEYSSYWSGKGNPDNKTVLDSSDDVARAKLGGKWRMPTYNEWQELYDNCTITWKTINGINGCIFTSTKPGHTGSCIFLPAAGKRDGKNFIDVGEKGTYWASTNTDFGQKPNTASLVTFMSWTKGYGNLARYLGHSVRPVQGK